MGENYPLGTNELYDHLGVSESGHAPHQEDHVPPLDMAIDLPHDPQAPALAHGPKPVSEPQFKDKDSKPSQKHDPVLEHDAQTNTYTLNLATSKVGKYIKNIFPYAAAFLVFLIIFYLLFTNVSFKSIFASKPASVKSTQTLPTNQQAAYNAWVRSYFYDVSDPSVLDPNNDISGNGLTNYQKFLLGLNPKKQDTLGLGMTDTQALMQGIDPLTGAQMTDAQKQFVAQNVDLETVSNRVTLAAAQSAPQAGSNSGDSRDSEVVIDTNKQGEVDIPSLHISAPLIWSQDVSEIENDLPNGLVHYPGTAMPGQIGTAYISGHSSNYAWVKGKYNDIFATLGSLKKYDSFSITVTDTSGKKIIFHYVVSDSNIFSATDPQQFANIGKSVVALSTCWPVGTSAKRLVVFGELTQTEK